MNKGQRDRETEGQKVGKKTRAAHLSLCPSVPLSLCPLFRPLPAFSLIEFTVVLALMGLLAGIVTLSVRPIMLHGKQSAARSEIATICQAIDTFYTVNGRYPTNDEGIAILTQKTEKMPEGLLKQLPVDPWNHPYQYNCPGRNEPYEVISFGADGREGGEGADRDLVSWDLKDRGPAK